MQAATAAAVLIVTGGCSRPVVAGAPQPEQRASVATPTTTRADRAPVRDGELEFTVVEVAERDVVGDAAQPGLSVRAHGVFVIVTLTIRNAGPAAVTFLDRYQRLVDDTGATFRPDMAADIYGNRHLPSTRMAPGAQLLVHLCFDVPVGSRARNLVARQSESTPGATVSLA